MQIMQKFERGMGLTLKNAWLHAEAVQVCRPDAALRLHPFGSNGNELTLSCFAISVQTTDIPLLIEYIHNIFSYCIENPDVRLLCSLHVCIGWISTNAD